MSESLTALEREVVELVARANWPGYRSDDIRVLRRENTGAGRYTYVADGHAQTLPDGSYSVQGRMIELGGVRNGLGFVVQVSSSQINHIEFFTFGNADWDGVECDWMII